MKVYSIQELSEMSLKDIKSEYDKLVKLYARRMYERSRENKELAEAIYGKRLTAGQLGKITLEEIQEESERYRYMLAYQQLSDKMGGEKGVTKGNMNSFVKTAMDSYKIQHGKNAKSELDAVQWMQGLKKLGDYDDFYDWYEDEIEETGADRGEAGYLLRTLKDKELVKEKLKNKYSQDRYFGL